MLINTINLMPAQRLAPAGSFKMLRFVYRTDGALTTLLADELVAASSYVEFQGNLPQTGNYRHTWF
jgi:hypothetical protein